MTTTSDITTSNGRRALHAYVDDAAHDIWHDYATEQGVSASAILQALADLGTFTADGPMTSRSVAAHMVHVIRRARAIDAARRRRNRRA